MADIKFKELEFDNVFDFCEVIKAVGADEILASVNPKEIAAMSEKENGMEAIGTMVAMKFGSILIKNFPKAKNEIYTFFAGCTEWDNGKEVEIDDIRKLKFSAAIKLIKDFTKLDDISDFFEGVSSFFNMDQENSKNL